MTNVRIASIATTNDVDSKVGGLVGINNGYITNSAVENITINGPFYVAGFACDNNGKIGSSYFKGGNVVNYKGTETDKSGTAGFVVNNNGKIAYSYAEALSTYDASEVVEYIIIDMNNKQDPVAIKYKEIGKGVAKGLSFTQLQNSAYVGYYYTYSVSSETGDNVAIFNARHFGNVVYSNKQASGFVYSNSGSVDNSYSNIVVAGDSTAGFVYYNRSGATIDSTYTMSSIPANQLTHSPFGARSTDGTTSQNSGSITNSYYLSVSLEDYISSQEEILNNNDFVVILEDYFYENIDKLLDLDGNGTAREESDNKKYNSLVQSREALKDVKDEGG